MMLSSFAVKGARAPCPLSTTACCRDFCNKQGITLTGVTLACNDRCSCSCLRGCSLFWERKTIQTLRLTGQSGCGRVMSTKFRGDPSPPKCWTHRDRNHRAECFMWKQRLVTEILWFVCASQQRTVVILVIVHRHSCGCQHMYTVWVCVRSESCKFPPYRTCKRPDRESRNPSCIGSLSPPNQP